MKDIWEMACDYAYLRFHKSMTHGDSLKWSHRWYRARLSRDT